MPGRLVGRVALVTGAGRGIGRAVAKLLAEQGARVIINDLGCEIDGTGASKIPSDSVVAEIHESGGKAAPSYDDVSTLPGAERAANTAITSFGRLDILVTSAGLTGEQAIEDVTEEEWQALALRQLKAVFAPVKYAAAKFRDQRSGRIVMMTSDYGLGAPGHTLSSAVGEGIIGFSRAVCRELGPYGVTVNAISPVARTRLQPRGLRAAAWATPDALSRAGLGAPVPLEAWNGPGGPADPENIAPLAVWLCTDAVANVNGNVFGARGGDFYLYSIPVIEKSVATSGQLTLDQIMEVAPKVFLTQGGF